MPSHASMVVDWYVWTFTSDRSRSHYLDSGGLEEPRPGPRWILKVVCHYYDALPYRAHVRPTMRRKHEVRGLGPHGPSVPGRDGIARACSTQCVECMLLLSFVRRACLLRDSSIWCGGRGLCFGLAVERPQLRSVQQQQLFVQTCERYSRLLESRGADRIPRYPDRLSSKDRSISRKNQ